MGQAQRRIVVQRHLLEVSQRQLRLRLRRGDLLLRQQLQMLRVISSELRWRLMMRGLSNLNRLLRERGGCQQTTAQP
jgi:hypothetical protein